MAKIEKPLQFKQIMEEHRDAAFAAMYSYGAVDHKGRYLHWTEFKRRLPASENKIAAWGAVKLARMTAMKRLGLKSDTGQSFTLYLTDYTHKIVHEVEQLTNRIGVVQSSEHGDNRKYLVDSLMMEEAISSAQLEGAATTRKVAKEMLENERAPKNDDERMILNNYLLMRQAKYSKDEELTVDLICEFHKLATLGVKDVEVHPGQIRDCDDIFVGGADGSIAHQPPPAETLFQRLTDICEFANTEHDGKDGRPFIHPVIKAIILHFMIGYEHPFHDGNGRTARALFYWFMLKHGYWAFEYISISSLLKEAPVQYGEAYLFTETDDFDLTYFVLYQLKVIERAMNEFVEYIERRRVEFFELMAWLDETGIGKTLNYRQGHLLKKALRNPGRVFTAKEVKNDYGISENTARTDLASLVKLKVLAKIEDGKHHYFISRNDAIENLRSQKIELRAVTKSSVQSEFGIPSIKQK